jgi:hypothetical protein
MREALARALAERPGGNDALTTLRDFILSGHTKTELDRRLERIICNDETLLSHKQARMSQLQELLAAAIADDLGAGADDLRAHVAAASLIAAFEVLERRDGGSSASYTTDEVAAAIDPVISFVRAGLEALPAPGRS